MKSLICSLALILSVLVSKAQFPITSTQGSVTTLTKPLGGLQAGVGLIMTVYTDTTTANLNAYLKTYNGALIYSLSDSALYFRSNGASKWVQILPSGGTTGLNAWLVGGNTPLLTDANGNATFGANQNSGIIFRTNSLTRLILDKGGIVRSSGAANKYLTYDTITKQLYYGDAASVANEWHITGNSGTTAGTNFVGTTDNVDLIFKRNSVLSGIIGSSNTSFGFGSSNSFTSGHNNTALGINSLHFTTSGSYNTAIGQASLYNNTTGGNNISVGENSLQANTTGTSNTAIGISSMYSNISGDSNIAVGSQAGYYSTTLSKRLYINSISRGNILGDTTKSIIYGYQDATAANQRLYLNSDLYLPYAASGVGTKALRINPGTGLITYADTTTASSTPTLQQVTDAGNTTTNTMKTPAILFHDIGNNKTVTVQPDDLDNNYIQMLRPKSGNIALYPLDSTATPENTITIGSDGYFHRAALVGSSLFPLTGTGTATGSVTGDMASNDLSIINGNVGIGSSSAPDSALTNTLGLWSKRGVRFSGLIQSPAKYILHADINGNVTYADTTAITATSPAGNYGNLQINRNGVFATPASDSLNFSGGILSTKGTLIQSGNGALSASAITGTGTWITGGSATTTKPYVLIEPTGTTSTSWSTVGTGMGINAASGFIGYLFDAQIAGVSKFTISNAGAIHTGYLSGGYFRNGNNNFHLYGANTGTGTIGALTLYDGSESGAAFLQMGGTSSSYPGISRNGTGIDIKLANNSAYTGIQSLYDRFGSGSPESVVTAPIGAVYHRTDGGAGTSYYVKESGSGNTGWVAK